MIALPGFLVTMAATGDAPASRAAAESPQSESCDRCGSDDTWWRNCKLLCRGCGAIVKSCADL